MILALEFRLSFWHPGISLPMLSCKVAITQCWIYEDVIVFVPV